MNESTFLSVFEGVPLFEINREHLKNGVSITSVCTELSRVFESKGELRRMIQGGGLSINKIRIDNPDAIISEDSLISNKYLLIQKGKKNYYLLRVI
jgi:tyrosyl-tRNA synthetase